MWCGEGLLEFLDDLGVGYAVEEHLVELVADFLGEPGDFAATGAGREEWIIGFMDWWIVGQGWIVGLLDNWIIGGRVRRQDVGCGSWFVVFCGHRFCVCFVLLVLSRQECRRYWFVGEIAVANGCGQMSTDLFC